MRKAKPTYLQNRRNQEKDGGMNKKAVIWTASIFGGVALLAIILIIVSEL